MQRGKSIQEVLTKQRDFEVKLKLKAIQNAPTLKDNRMSVSGNMTFCTLRLLLCEKLNASPMFLYVDDSFEPNGDDYLGDIFQVGQFI